MTSHPQREARDRADSQHLEEKLRREMPELSSITPPAGVLGRVLDSARGGAEATATARPLGLAAAAGLLLTAGLALWFGDTRLSEKGPSAAEPPTAAPATASSFQLTNDGPLVLLREGDQVLSLHGESQ